jgi:hypothetical protein
MFTLSTESPWGPGNSVFIQSVTLNQWSFFIVIKFDDDKAFMIRRDQIGALEGGVFSPR